MRLWATISQRLRVGAKRGLQARHELAEAYRRVFTGRGSAEDAEAVLADLANASGFYKVTEVGFAGDVRAFQDGKRAVFGRIFGFLRMTDEEMRALEIAAREEALISAREGEI